MRILNAYAGIGGNRKNWDGEKHDIVAVEINEEVAEEYKRLYPEDEVIVGDAHTHILENYQEYDFIWSSPPCPTHSSIRKAGVGNGQYDAKYPDMKLYQEIIFLKNFFDGDFVVENVNPYYRKDIRYKKSDLLVEPQDSAEHVFWSNFSVPEVDVERKRHNDGNTGYWQEWLGIEVKDSWSSIEKRKVLRNAVHPRVGERILKSRNSRQSSLDDLV